MISYETKSNDSKFRQLLSKMRRMKLERMLKKYGEKGVAALSEATPKATGYTASSWYYEIEENQNGITRLIFRNGNVVDEWCNIAIILDAGHGTRNGGWVEGRHYIDPAIRPVFDEIADGISWEVHNI